MLVDEPSEVVIWECNQNPWQRWNFTYDGLIKLVRNPSAFHTAPLVLLTD